MIKKLLTLFALLTMLLPDMGACTGWLDSISPKQFVDLIDNPDGTYTAIWKTDDDSSDE